MAINVTEIQNRIAAIVDQSATAPTEGGTDWATRLKYINIANSEFGQLYDWQCLFKEYNTQTSTSTGNVSVALPQDFRKLASFPRIVSDGSNSTDFAEIRPQERSHKLSSDKFFYFLGNPASGYTMVINSGNSNGQLPSGASIYISYYASAGSLASGMDTPVVPDTDFLVKRAIALHWQASDDARFSNAQSEAEKIMQRMLERESVFSEANNDESRIRTIEEKRHGFRLGRD